MQFSQYLMESEKLTKDEAAFLAEYDGLPDQIKKNSSFVRMTFRENMNNADQPIDLTTPFQHEIIKRSFLLIDIIDKIKNPILELQTYAINNLSGHIAADLTQIDKSLITTLLTDEKFILNRYKSYEFFVKKYFKDNSLLLNKWLRYAKSVSEAA